MKTTAAQKIKVGIFTIIGAGVLLTLVFVIGSRKNLFSDTFLINASFQNIGGLQIGNTVRFSGIDAGTISGINIQNDSTILISMKIKERIHPFLKTDATISIGSDGLMGDKIINISPGKGNGTVIRDGGQLRATNPIEFDRIIERISKVADNAEMITSSLADIATQVSSGKGSIGRLIYSDSLERGLERTVSSARQTVQSAKKGVEGFQENMEAMKHNFLLKGYYKKKARREKERAEKQQNNPQ